MNVVDTLIIEFGQAVAASGGSISAEWDDTVHLDSDGNVMPSVPGDELFLLVHAAAGIEIVSVGSTLGTVTELGVVGRSREDLLSWGDAEDLQSLSYEPRSAPVFYWYGRQGLDLTRNGRDIAIAREFPCLAGVTYGVEFQRFRIATPSFELAAEETFPLRAYIYYREVSS